LVFSYLCNSKSYNKYVIILQTGIVQRNSTEKNCIQSRLTINKKVCIVGAGSYWPLRVFISETTIARSNVVENNTDKKFDKKSNKKN